MSEGRGIDAEGHVEIVVEIVEALPAVESVTWSAGETLIGTNIASCTGESARKTSWCNLDIGLV